MPDTSGAMFYLIYLFALLSIANGHSWVECVSYDPITFNYETLGGYDSTRCSGYPRGFERQFQAGFGVDTGYNWGHDDCMRDPFKQSDYTNEIVMARYQPGQTIYISHPAKNHVADECTNPFIPSASFKVLMSSQTGVDLFDIELPMFGEEHVNGVIDHLGYQRCFNFCDNTDKAHCISAWTLPTDIADGVYSFRWAWEFNPKEYYSNCFDAFISSDTTAVPKDVNTSSGSSLIDKDTSDSDNDVSFPATSLVPTPAATMDTSIETPSNIPEPTEQVSMSPPIVETPAPAASNSTPDIITSGAPMLISPFAWIGSYLINITGSMNITISEVV